MALLCFSRRERLFFLLGSFIRSKNFPGFILLSSIFLISAAPVFSQTSIFQTNGSNTRSNDGSALELGMKFRSSQSGFITGIRFYKPSGTTGIHIGNLWTSSGTLLGSVTFANESSSGWQQVSFGAPIAINANTTYVASYFSSSGDYSVTNPYFTSATVNGPLRALADGEDGDNGLYRYSSSSAFPTNNYGTSNYWVDVVFAGNAGPDVTPPNILSATPVSGATGVSIGTDVTTFFNEAMDASTINSSTIELRNASNTLIPASVSYNSGSISATLTPSSALASSTLYTVTVKGGSSGVKDAAGNALASNYSWNFTTGSPPPSEGSGGPILVISSAANPFSRYPVEILRAEGLNEFIAMDISSVNSSVLSNYDVAILGEMTVTSTQVTMLTNWVNAGGVLIAFKPSSLLTPLMGISNASGTLSDKYLLVNTSSGPGVGIVNQTIQFHGTANLHSLNGASSVATLYSSSTTATSNPAVTMMNVGTNGGKAFAFTYDLASSIVYTRQGNPAKAGAETDGVSPVRPDDLFYSSYVDLNKVAIPQADEQQRLLANIIIQSNLAKKPLPRFWYMPKGLKAAVVFALDDHGTFSGTKDVFDKMIANSPAGCSVDDWECFRATSWLYVGIPLTNTQANNYNAQGFEMGVHVQNGCEDFSSFSDLNSYYNSQFQQFKNSYPNLPAQTTHRFHCLVWSDWLTQAKVELSRGVRLSLDYYYWPPNWINGRSGMFTGSGMPMRFADTDGSMIDIYQGVSQLVNENGINYSTDVNTLLDRALGTEGYYGFFGTHDDYRDQTFSSTAIAAAKSHNVPIITARQLLTWLDGRNGSYFGNMTWNGNQLTVPITAISGARNLKCMLPYNSATGQLTSITRNGSPLSFTTQTIKGLQYVFFDVALGTSTYVATYTGAGSAPTITTQPITQTVCEGSDVTFTSAATGTPAPTVQWQVSTNGGSSWSNISGATNSTLTFIVTSGDNNKRYRARWTNSQGNTNSNAAILTVNSLPAAPLVNVTNNCGNSVLTASNYTGTLLWSTGATTPSITVSAGGTYTVTQTVNGCTSQAGSGTAAPNTAPPAPTVSVVNNCGNSVLTAANFTGTLLWSTGATTSSITVTTGGTYTVTQMVNGCISVQGSGTAAPKTIPSAPTVSVTDNCGNSVLTAGNFTGSLLWSTGATTSSITVTTGGTYTVTQTVNGCTSPTGSGTAAPKTIPSAPTVSVTDNCGNSVLTAGNFTGSLLWSTGETTSSITVTTGGTYPITQMVNGCISVQGSGTAAPKAIPSAPTVSVIDNCGSSTLTAGDFTGSLLWSTGETTSSITVTTGGTYTVTQTVNGCTSLTVSGTATPKIIPSAPTVDVEDNCGNSVLTAGNFSGSLLWSTGETTSSITVPAAGAYSVTQTINGCTGPSGGGTATPKEIPAVPSISAENNCGSSVLTADNFSGSLLWSTGETTASITVTTGGTYTVTQTVNGCTSAEASILAKPKLIPPAPTVSVIDDCGNSVLTAENYTGDLLWSTGETTASITVTTGGSYTVTQTIDGCTSTGGSGTAAPKAIPSAPTVTVVNNCGNSVLTAENYTGDLLWSTGETTPSITVTTGGTYTVTQKVNGCASNEASAVANPEPPPVAPTVSAVDNCGSSVLTADNYTGSLLWSTGETTASITVATGGTYTVIQTVNGCTSAQASILAEPKLVPSAPTVSVIDDCGNSILTADNYTGSLLWSTGETTASITVITGGTYTVTQTIDGCTGSAGSGLAVPKLIPSAPTVDVQNNCRNSVLTADNYTGSLLWSTGETTASITVTTGGTYTVTQTVNGCTSDEASAVANPEPPPVAPTVSAVDDCGSSVLTADNFTGSLLWSTGETTASITVVAGGTYTVTQTIDGCTSNEANILAAPKIIPGAPEVTVINNCNSSELIASGFTGNLLWSTGETTASITVTTGGTYTVTQTIDGCTGPSGSGIATPKIVPPAPTVNVENNCGNSVLTATNHTGDLLWSTGETTASITVTAGGSYTVTQTVDGCTSAEANGVAAPKIIPSAPSIDVVNNCGNSVLTATNFTGSLLWSTGETTASITVTAGGIYTVTQTIDGCTSTEGSATATPKTIPAAPIVIVSNNCGNSQLIAGNYTGTLLWSTGATTPSITVTTPGTYTVTQTVNGCTGLTGSGLAEPVFSTAPAPTVTVVNNCGSSLLTASNYTGTLIWSTGETTASITVSVAGTYTVSQIQNGCPGIQAIADAAPKVIPAAPTVSVVNNCGSSVLTAENYTGDLLWSTGETTPSITVTTGGTYTVTQTINGCTGAEGSGVATPKLIPAAPTVSVVNNCGSSVLTAENYTGDLLWSTGETTPSITVTTGGTYTVTQTIDGCTSSAGSGLAEPIISLAPAPTVTVENNCGSSILTASDYTGNLLWSTGETTASITVTTGGIYTVTQTENGCPGLEGGGNATPKVIPAAPTVTVVNDCGSSVLTAENHTGDLLWSTGETTASITVTAGGTYTVTQTIDGCTSTEGSGTAAPKTIPSAPTVTVVNSCGNSVLTAENYTGDLLWSTGETTASITVTAGGTYTVTQTIDGCTGPTGSGLAEPIISLAPAPTVSITDNCGSSVLTASNYTGALLWSTGETTSSITVTTAGTYTVTQTENGCPGIEGSGVAAPKVIPGAPEVIVSDDCGSSVLTANNYTGDLLWSTGETTSSITVTQGGTYTVTQTIDGCISAEGSGIAAPKSIPVAPTVGVVDDCGNSVLTAENYTGNLLWSTGETTASITVPAAGTYNVTQTVNGCTSANGSGTAAPKSIPATPTVSVVNDCSSSVLTAENYTGDLLWSTGETTASITVTTAGTYTVTQTINGCTSAGGSGVAAPKPIPAAPTVDVQNDCESSLLTAANYTGNLLWNTGETTASITVTAAGTYTVTQTLDGCTSAEGSGIAAPKSIPAAPTVSVVDNCGSSILTADNYTGSLLWSTGETIASITVPAAGTYTVTQTVNGCTSTEGSGIAAPKSIPAAPTVSVVDNCGSSVLTAENYTGSLLWSTGETTASITVPAAGTYTVTQTINGCTSADGSGVAAPKTIPAAPTVNVQNDCESSLLTAGNYTGSLLWSTGETTSSITVPAAGTYTVTQAINGCTSADGSGVAAPGAGVVIKPVITANGPVAFCVGGSVTLTSSLATGNLWSTGATTQSIVVSSSGSYTVQDLNGGTCAGPSDPAVVTANPPPAGIISVLSQTICDNTPASVIFNATSGTGPYSVVINGTTYNNVTSGSTINLGSTQLTNNSLWSNSTTPAIAVENDGVPLEVGMKFRTSSSGFIRSLRFYKGSNNDAGTYTLKLYQNSTRVLLGSVDFSNRTATGWQTVDLPVPVPVTAGTTYLVSYYSSSGNYASSINYFIFARTNGPITGLANGTDGSNGVYRYGAGGGYPTNMYGFSNYWADVVFTTPVNLTFNLTSITDANNCSVSGNLGSVNLQVTPCSGLLTRSVGEPEGNSAALFNEAKPLKAELGQNHPNPFETSTLVDFAIPKTGKVRLALYDMNGREVQVLLNEIRKAGFYTIPVRKKQLAAGIYYYRLEYGNQTLIKKMMIL